MRACSNCAAGVAALAAIWFACGSRDSSQPSSQPTAAAEHATAAAAPGEPPAKGAAAVVHPDPSLPVSKRILGKWRIDLSKVPDRALTDEFRKLKRRGKADSLLITYTVTDTQFELKAWSGREVWNNRFDYEILREDGDTLLLKKTDERGEQSEIGVILKDDDQLLIGTGNGQVPLQRMPSGPAR